MKTALFRWIPPIFMKMDDFWWNGSFWYPKTPSGGNGTRNHKYSIGYGLLGARGRQGALLRAESHFLRNRFFYQVLVSFRSSGWQTLGVTSTLLCLVTFVLKQRLSCGFRAFSGFPEYLFRWKNWLSVSTFLFRHIFRTCPECIVGIYNSGIYSGFF